MLRYVEIVILIGICSSHALAQRGMVEGRVTDSQRAVLISASLTLEGVDRTESTTTDAVGTYRFEALLPGNYRITARFSGFGPVTRDVVLKGSASVELNFLLQPVFSLTIVVTASRSEHTLLDVPATVTVIPAAEVQAKPAYNFADLLRGATGLNTVQMNPRDINFDSRTASGVLSNSQLAMVDGRSVYSSLGNVFWDLVPVNYEDIEQIEFIATPSSATWGADALTGVVNVRTKSPRSAPGGTATIGYGEAGIRRASMRWAQALERFSYRVSASHFEQNAWERDNVLPDGSPMPLSAVFENQGTKQEQFDSRLDWEPQAGKLWSGRMGFADSNGIIHTTLGPSAWADSGSYSMNGSLEYTTDAFNGKFYWNRIRGDTKFLVFDVDLSATSDLYVGDFTGRRALGKNHAFVYGGSLRLNSFDLTVAPDHSFRSDVGVFIQDQVFITPKLTWGIGARVDKFDTFAATVSPRTSLVFRPFTNHSFRFAFNRAFRAPSLLENFIALALDNPIPLAPGAPSLLVSTAAVGNRELRPEVMRAFEVGYTTDFGNRVAVSATLYHNSLRDNIRFLPVAFFGPDNPPPGWPLPPGFAPMLPETMTFLNVGTVRDRGLELSAHVDWKRGISARISYSLQDETKVTKSDQSLPLQLNQPPTHQAAIDVFYTSSNLWGSVGAAYVGEAFWSDVLDSRFWGTTPSYILTHAKVGITLPGRRVDLLLNATNLFNRRVKQHVFGDIFRRQVSAELRFRW